ASSIIQREIRGTLAGADYYAAWLMRLEGAPAEEWLLPIESPRQHFRMLAEQTATDTVSADYQKNLEASIRLELMDLSELKGIPLQKFFSGYRIVSQKCRS